VWVVGCFYFTQQIAAFHPGNARTGLFPLLYNQLMPKKKQLENFKAILQKQLPVLREQYAVATLEVFGSYVRHEEKTDSDLDILVTFSKAPSILKFIRLEHHLSDILGVKVDLVLKDSLKPAIEKIILREAEPVL
jgi:uncharacterized protein